MDPDDAARRLQRLQKMGLKEIEVLSSPLRGTRHVYRVVSRRFTMYVEARLAVPEAARLLSGTAVTSGEIEYFLKRSGSIEIQLTLCPIAKT